MGARTGGVLRDDGGHRFPTLFTANVPSSVVGGVLGIGGSDRLGLLVEVRDEERFQDIPGGLENSINPIQTPKGCLLWQSQLRMLVLEDKGKISTLCARIDQILPITSLCVTDLLLTVNVVVGIFVAAVSWVWEGTYFHPQTRVFKARRTWPQQAMRMRGGGNRQRGVRKGQRTSDVTPATYCCRARCMPFCLGTCGFSRPT